MARREAARLAESYTPDRLRTPLVRDGKGRSELVQDLGDLWPAAEKLAGRPLDPLDPALLDALTEGG